MRAQRWLAAVAAVFASLSASAQDLTADVTVERSYSAKTRLDCAVLENAETFNMQFAASGWTNRRPEVDFKKSKVVLIGQPKISKNLSLARVSRSGENVLIEWRATPLPHGQRIGSSSADFSSQVALDLLAVIVPLSRTGSASIACKGSLR